MLDILFFVGPSTNTLATGVSNYVRYTYCICSGGTAGMYPDLVFRKVYFVLTDSVAAKNDAVKISLYDMMERSQ